MRADRLRQFSQALLIEAIAWLIFPWLDMPEWDALKVFEKAR